MSGALPRFYPILDAAAVARRGCSLAEAAEAILAAGAGILQLRAKGALTRELLAGADAAAKLCRSRGARFIVNDRADLALLAQAGLHVGQEDLPAEAARRLMGEAMLGLSTHNEAQARLGDAEPVDYLAIGPVFGTVSKANPDPEVGLEGVFKARRVTGLPLVAIGGIGRGNARAVLEAGADSVAVISDLMPEPFTLRGLRERAREWMNLVER